MSYHVISCHIISYNHVTYANNVLMYGNVSTQ